MARYTGTELIPLTIQGYLESNSYNFDFDEEKKVFYLGFTLDNTKADVRFIYNEEREWFAVIVFPKNTIPMGGINKVLPVLNKINNDILFGNIYIDPEDGELAVRTALSVDNRTINEDMVGVAMSTAIGVTDDNINAIMRALYAEEDED